MGDPGLLWVNPSELKIIAAARIYLNCCRPLHLPACLYNFLMFWKYLCSKISFLLNDWSIPIVFTCYLWRVYSNIPLSTTHCCSNVLIQKTESITLVIILDLIHLAAWAVLPSLWKHIDYLFTGGNSLVVCKFNKLTDVASINCAWWFVVEVVGMLICVSLCFTRCDV